MTAFPVGRACNQTEMVGDLAEPIELAMVIPAEGGGTTELEDGDDVTLIQPPQGGEVLVIGTRARNLVTSGVRVSAWLIDPASGATIGLEERPAQLAATAEGWAEPEDPASITNYAHVAACPSPDLPRDVNDQIWELVLRVEDCRGGEAETRLTVTPRCLEPGNEAVCACRCDQGFTPGVACEGDPPPDPDPSDEPPDCFAAAAPAATRQYRSIPTQTGRFSFQVDVTPSSDAIDAAVALSGGQPTAWDDLAAIVQFRPDGEIAVRDGGGYLGTGIAYAANATYGVRLIADVAANTYDAYLTGPDGIEELLGADLGFRVPVAQLDTFALFSDTGAIQACDVLLP